MRFFRDGPNSNRIPPTAARLILKDGWQALVDEGDLEGLLRHKWTSNTRGYVICTEAAKPRQLHRILICAQPGQIVDHINGNPLDNRRCNLRLVTPGQNVVNSSKSVGKSSRYKGVHFNKHAKKWTATITVNGQMLNLGRYTREKDAALAYDNAALNTWGEFARPNFPQSAHVEAR